MSASLFWVCAPAVAAVPPDAPLDTGPKIGYENFEAPGVFTTTVQSNGNTTEYLGRGAGEPSIGINWKSATPANPGGVTNFQSDLQTIFVTFDDSCPAGGPKSLWVNRPAPTSQGVDSDPIGFTNTTTGRVFAGELTLLSPTCKISYTDNDGASWTATTGPGGSGVDHQTIGGGPYHDLPVGGQPPYAAGGFGAFYYCSQDIAAAYCLRSDDGGLSWQQGTQMYTLATCGGLHGHVKVSPADGTVYVPNADCGSGIGAVAVSTDNATTWTVRNVTSGTLTTGPSDSDPAVGIDKAGRVYFAQATRTGNTGGYLTVATSTDQGVTWSNMYNVTSQLGIKGVRYPAAVGGDAGRAAIAFLGTKTAGDLNGDGLNGNGDPLPGHPVPVYLGTWDLYIAQTFDGGATWTVTDATPSLPVQRGCIWTGGGGDICRNLLDFFDVYIDKQGRVEVGYVNGCPGGSCPVAPDGARGNGYSATATIARQSSGRRLIAAFDPPNPATATSVPGMPTVVARRIGTTVHLAWSEGDTGNSPITEYQVWRGTAAGAETLLTTVAGDQSRFEDTSATDFTKTYYYKVIAVNAVGPSCGNNEIKVEYVGDTCPGLVIHQNDPAHPESAVVQNGLNKNVAIDYFSVAEPIADLKRANGTKDADGGTYFKFTMKVSDLSTVPVNSRWRMVWDSYDAQECVFGADSYSCPGGASNPNAPPPPQLFYVGMRTDSTGTPTFTYGTVGDAGLPAVLVLSESNDHNAYPESGFTADGTINVYVPKSGVGVLDPGDLLGALGGKTFTGDTAGTNKFQRSTALADHTFVKGVTDNSFPAATYMMRDAEHVTNNHNPVASTFTADKVYGNPPLAVTFGASQSDADGDAPGAYKFDYGDGSAAETKSCGNAPYLTPSCATPAHTYTNPGYYTATMWPIDSCGLQGAPLTIQIHVNAPPVANAGSDFAVTEGQTAMLSGVATTDADHDPADVLTYEWTQTAGPTVTLDDPSSITPSFTAPGVSANTPLTFQLKVTDAPGDGSLGGGGLSSTDTVTVTVNNLNIAPVADAGVDFDVDEGQTAMLSGAGSDDVDGDALSYAWSQTAGPTVVLVGDDTATPHFTAPAVAVDTPLTFQLTVTDVPGALSSVDSVVVTVINVNLPPVANAGPDAAIDENATGTLDGSGSTEPDGEGLTYSWTQVGGPPVVMSGVTTATPGFTAPNVSAPTILRFRLTVKDPHDATATDDVAIAVRDLGAAPAPIGNTAVGGLSGVSVLLLGISGLLRRRRPR